MSEHRSNVLNPGFIRIPCACTRCGGSGEYSKFHGVCFRCGGNGKDPQGMRVYSYPRAWTDEQVEAHVAKRAKAAEASRRSNEKKAQRVLDEWLAAHPEVPALLERADKVDDSFCTDVAMQAKRRPLTDRQVEALAKALDRAEAFVEKIAAETVTAKPCPTGTVRVQGVIISTKVKPNPAGSFLPGQLKMLVKGDGWKLWGSVPAALKREGGQLADREVRFTATCEASDDDPSFGFFTHPSKAEFV